MFRSKIVFCVISLLIYSQLLLANNIKIGVAGPFSGPSVSRGDQQWQGAYQAVEDINEQGGVNGKKLVLISADTACDIQQAQEAATKLINANVSAVVGSNCSRATIASSKLYSDSNIAMITPASTNPRITEEGYQNVFRTCGRDDDQSKIAVNYIVNKLNAKNIIIIHDQSLHGTGLADLAKEALQSLGANIVLFETVTEGQTDFTELVQKINKNHADVIYYAGLHTEAGRLLRSIRSSKNEITFFASDKIATSDFIQAAGGPHRVEGVYMTFSKPYTSWAEKKVIKRLEERRVSPDRYTLNSYAAVQAIAQAIKQSGSHESKDIIEWLHNNKVNSVIGELEWDKKGDLKNTVYGVFVWNDDGSYKLVD